MMFAFPKKKMRNKKEDFNQSAVPVPLPLLLRELQLILLQGLQQHLQEPQPILHPPEHLS